MIYEKREVPFGVKREDMPVKASCPEMRQTNNPRQGISCQPIIQSSQRLVCSRGIRRGYKRHSRGRLLFAAVLVILCVLVIDSHIFGGRFRSGMSDVAQRGARYTLENLAESKQAGSTTLYARLLSDRSSEFPEKEDVPYEDQSVSTEQQMKTESSAVTVSGITSQSFVDGERFYPITALDLSADSLYSLTNATSFSPDMKKLSEIQPKALEGIRGTDEPLVLIVHTHGEECYTEYVGMYPETEATRTPDTSRNVVRVGKEIKDTLSDFGIEALHCTTMHDSESFINAYSGSAASVRQYLEEYPSVRVVIDVHRDAIIRDDGESIKTSAKIAGEEYAQLMFVVGTNELGHNHPYWQDNLSLALTLQKSIESTYPSLCRSINLRDVPFNQQLSSGYLLLEVGSCANTLDEALRSARAFGENLARTLAAAE